MPIVFSFLWNQGEAISMGYYIVLLLYMILTIINYKPLSRAVQQIEKYAGSIGAAPGVCIGIQCGASGRLVPVGDLGPGGYG
ncbi:MAG TPA: hypothetical protein PLY57_08110, partial [Deltaproteobacteria bacterium]|nr:hypothetical protein [Deltaproteobacteria bacterium]